MPSTTPANEGTSPPTPQPAPAGWASEARHWSVSAKLITLIAPLLVIFLVLFAWAFAGRQRIQVLEQQTTVTAEAILAQIRADREYYSSVIVPRLFAMQATVEADYHQTPNAFPLPATFLREVTEMIAQSPSAFRVKLISPWPINKNNGVQDIFEDEGFRSLLDNDMALYSRQGTRRRDRRHAVPGARPCCGTQLCELPQRASGQPEARLQARRFIGGIEIILPIETALRSARRDQLWLVSGGAAVSLIVMLLIVWGSRTVVTKPVRELTAQMQKVARAGGDVEEEPTLRRRTANRRWARKSGGLARLLGHVSEPSVPDSSSGTSTWNNEPANYGYFFKRSPSNCRKSPNPCQPAHFRRRSLPHPDAHAASEPAAEANPDSAPERL